MGSDAIPLAARQAADVKPDSEPEVLVVGAGPVGLFTALLLAQRGIEVQIVEQARRLAARSYALALHPGSLALLDRVGLAKEALVRSRFDSRFASTAEKCRAGLAKWYGKDRAGKVRYAEAFEVCEYGRQPDAAEVRKLFPFFPEP